VTGTVVSTWTIVMLHVLFVLDALPFYFTKTLPQP